MFNAKRLLLYSNYISALNYFKANPKQLIDLEHFITELVNTEIRINYPD